MHHLILAALTLPSLAYGRNFNRSGLIVFEEAWSPAELNFFGNTLNANLPPGITLDHFLVQINDIHNERLNSMNALNISYMVLSLASPGAQGFSDPVQAQNVSVVANNVLAEAISNNTERFGAFAALSMHNATEAAIELKRAVTELGFLGALLNDYQESGPDNATLLYYDQPEYDPFWAVVQELNVPIYLHPRSPINQITALEYTGRHWLIGPSWQYASSTSAHALGLCVNGVFDRFPNVTVILGHMGERIPSDHWRADQQLARANPLPPMQRTIMEYYQTNLISTTAGEFYTPLLDFHIREIGADRIMFSIDYPFQSLQEGVAWFNGVNRSIEEIDMIGTTKAIEVLGLDR